MLGERIKKLREAKKMSSAALARAVHIAAPSLWEIENGETKSLRADTLMRLAAALETNPVYLWSGTGNQAMTVDPNDEEAEAVTLLRKMQPEARLAWIMALRAFAMSAPANITNPFPSAPMPPAPKKASTNRVRHEAKHGKK